MGKVMKVKGYESYQLYYFILLNFSAFWQDIIQRISERWCILWRYIERRHQL